LQKLAPRIFRIGIAIAVMLLVAARAQAQGSALSLAEAQRLAVAQSPQIAAQHSLVDSAGFSALNAGALPNPKLITGVEDLTISSPTAWTLQDAHTGLYIGMSQMFPGGSKRSLRTQRAEQDASREASLLAVERAQIEREVATAWIMQHYADEAEAAVIAQIDEAKLAVSAASAGYRSDRAPQTDLIAAQAAVVDLKNRRTEVTLQAKRGRIALARYIGPDAERPLGNLPDTTKLPAAVARFVDGDDLPEVRAAKAEEDLAVAESNLAHEDRWPDWELELVYGYRGYSPTVAAQPFHAAEPGSKYGDWIALKITIELPLFNWSNDNPLHAAKLKELDAARAMREEVRRKYVAEVQGMIAEWESAWAQARRTRDELLPLTVQRREAAMAAYRGGTGSLGAVLDARRAELDAKLTLIAQEQAAAKAWAWLAFVFPVSEPS